MPRSATVPSAPRTYDVAVDREAYLGVAHHPLDDLWPLAACGHDRSRRVAHVVEAEAAAPVGEPAGVDVGALAQRMGVAPHEVRRRDRRAEVGRPDVAAVFARIAASTSRPERSGRYTSRSTRSGRSLRTCASASAPVCAVPTTLNPGMRSLKARCTDAIWKSSSTTSVRIIKGAQRSGSPEGGPRRAPRRHCGP